MQPARYIAALMLAWGIVATFTAFVQNLAGLLACRLLLGFFEAGLFPGVIVGLTPTHYLRCGDRLTRSSRSISRSSMTRSA